MREIRIEIVMFDAKGKFFWFKKYDRCHYKGFMLDLFWWFSFDVSWEKRKYIKVLM